MKHAKLSAKLFGIPELIDFVYVDIQAFQHFPHKSHAFVGVHDFDRDQFYH